MADPTTQPPREAVLVAQHLGTTADQLTGIKLAPGEWVGGGQLPSGWTIATREPVTFSDDHGFTQRLMTRYDTPAGPVVSVAHESGEEIFAVISAAADVVGLVGGIAGLFAMVKRQPGPRRRRRYTDTGRVSESADLDDGKPLADQLEPPTGGTATPG